MKLIEGQMGSATGRYALVAARFNSFIVDRLVEGAVDTLSRHGLSEADITLVKVPGAFEIPQICRRLADSGNYQAVIALGCVIRGATPHFDYVAGECAKGLGQVAADSSCAVVFGVLTTDTIEQAIERAGSKAGNKGADAAAAAIEMVDLLAKITDPG
jgi:6,7-dimethyl-8-ribityllumazine synthase